jgi:hypothetical protein
MSHGVSPVGMIGDASDKTPITSVCLRARIEMVPIWGGFDPDWGGSVLAPRNDGASG